MTSTTTTTYLGIDPRRYLGSGNGTVQGTDRSRRRVYRDLRGRSELQFGNSDPPVSPKPNETHRTLHPLTSGTLSRTPRPIMHCLPLLSHCKL